MRFHRCMVMATAFPKALIDAVRVAYALHKIRKSLAEWAVAKEKRMKKQDDQRKFMAIYDNDVDEIKRRKKRLCCNGSFDA